MHSIWDGMPVMSKRTKRPKRAPADDVSPAELAKHVHAMLGMLAHFDSVTNDQSFTALVVRASMTCLPAVSWAPSAPSTRLRWPVHFARPVGVDDVGLGAVTPRRTHGPLRGLGTAPPVAPTTCLPAAPGGLPFHRRSCIPHPFASRIRGRCELLTVRLQGSPRTIHADATPVHLARPVAVDVCPPSASGTISGPSARLRRAVHLTPPVAGMPQSLLNS